MTKQARRFAKLSSVADKEQRKNTSNRLGDLRNILAKSREVAVDFEILSKRLAGAEAKPNQPFLFTVSATVNEAQFHRLLADCQDVVFRKLTFGGRPARLIYLDGLCDSQLLESGVLRPLLKQASVDFSLSLLDCLSCCLAVPGLELTAEPEFAIQAVLTGKAVILVEGFAEAVTVEVAKYVKRSIEEPKGEGGSVTGPQAAFNETLRDNITLLRRRIVNADMKVRLLSVGYLSKTAVAVVYIDSLVKPGLVEEVELRLRAIQTDAVFFAATIGEYFSTRKWSPISQYFTTERPEAVAMAICEGRVGILVDNSPFVLIVPCTLTSILQTVDDYTMPPVIASLVRITRYVSGFVAVFLLPLYIALISFHPGTLPVSLAMSIAELRTRTPFPTIIEVLFMEGLLEIFQESIIRLPIRLTGAASMLGAFVIGTTVVQAGLINPLLVVVTAGTAIASYTMPLHSLGMSVRWLRLPAIAASAVLGIYGVVLAFLIFLVHACFLRNFGESYLGGLLDVALWQDWKDTFIRKPIAQMQTRPRMYGAKDEGRKEGSDG